MKYAILTLSTAALALSACGGTVATVAAAPAPAPAAQINVPVTGAGKVAAIRVSGRVSAQTTGGTFISANPRSTLVVGRTDAGGATFDYTADTPTNQRAAGATAQQVDVEVDVANFQNVGSAPFNTLTDEAATLFFENGNFGGPQVNGSTDLNVSGVDVFNPTGGQQIVLSDVSTFRAQSYDGTNTTTDQAISFGVGFVGKETTNMPAAGSATYRTFIETGASGYDDGGTFRRASLRSSTGEIAMTADFAAARMTTDVDGLTYSGQDAGGTDGVRNAQVDGLIITAPIVGSTYGAAETTGGIITGLAPTAIAGSQVRIVDAADTIVGTAQAGEVVGGFFGDAASEHAAGVIIQGTMDIDNGTATAPRDYIVSFSLGGTQ